MSTSNYEQVPDVEQGAAAAPAPASYSELPDNQAHLMKDFDAAAATANLEFEMPAADPNELASKGKDMIMSMLTPTITAVAAMASGLWLNYEAQYSALAGFLVLCFPYINSTLQFATSIKPLQDRLYSAVEPIFAKKESAEEEVAEGFENITRTVDKKVDSLQEEVGDVLDPLKPTLDKASAQAAPLKRLDPDLDIPDYDDIDEEFDEAQGKVGDRVDAARNQFSNVNQYLPEPLHSAKNFYWRIVFPVLLTALLLQLSVAFITTYSTQKKQAAAAESTDATRRNLRASVRALADVVDLSSAVPVDEATAQAAKAKDAATAAAQEQISGAKDAASEQLDAATAQAAEAKDAATSAAQEQIAGAKDAASEQLDAATAQAAEAKDAAAAAAAEKADEIKGQVADAKDAATAQVNDAKDAAAAAAAEKADEIKGQVDDAKAAATEQLDAAATQVNDAKEAAAAAAAEKADEIKGQIDDAKAAATEQLDAAAAQVNEAKDAAAAAAKEKADEIKAQMDDAKAQARDQLEAGKKQLEDAKAQAQDQLEAGKEQLEASKAEAEAEIEAAKKKMKEDGKKILISTITAWLMSLLQMGLVFLMTDPRVKAWVINQMVTQVKDEANRQLRATGVPDMLHDVLVVRMGRIKAKLYKVFSVFGRIEKLMDKLQGLSNIPGVKKISSFSGVGKAKDKASGVMDKMEDSKVGKAFGKFGFS
eukprot:CAMPEP_0168736768 /NCGR_PEP_ID=MMETSP0724-20121128/10033_1 /TAXON_ID=265536 /ORGANISM="Amphiprora sp., Strain CCMP467" /LENGTH=707 /DNA_ID=CAMNT_0008783981 /DNA_START=71 /DNA_END=2194 /DNA_ORIENTATION=+